MEASIERQILAYLHGAGEPRPLASIAEGTACSMKEATNLIRDLIRQRRVERHHVGPGELRYALKEDFVPETFRRGRPTPRKRVVGPGPKQQQVLDLLGDRRMTAGMLTDLSSELTQAQVSNLLGMLRAKGLVDHDHAQRPRWYAVRAPRATEDDELPPCVGERMRETTYDIHRAADEAALEDTRHA